jgi:hypothetical protein
MITSVVVHDRSIFIEGYYRCYEAVYDEADAIPAVKNKEFAKR